MIHTVSTAARATLEQDNIWAKGFAPSSKVVRRSYAVMVHGVRTSLNTTDQNAAIEKLTRENIRLHPGLEILRATWPRKLEGSGKTFSSLVIEVASEVMADRILDYGFRDGHIECSTEYFERNSKVVQCFKCWKYGHISKHCQNEEICHECKGNHDPRKCLSNTKTAYCPACKKSGHKPWAKSCPARKDAKAKADTAFANRPYRYSQTNREAPTDRASFSSQGSTTVNSRSRSPRKEVDAEGYQIVDQGKRKKLAGRPVGAPNRAKSLGAGLTQPIISEVLRKCPINTQADVTMTIE